ncbi:MAG: hypothetical protein ABIP65_08740 [Vicinamibacterales bacterium]
MNLDKAAGVLWLLAAWVASPATQGTTGQGGRALPSSLLTRLETAVEREFRQLERTSTVRVRDVTVTPRNGGAVLAVVLALPRDQRFEVHVENAYARIWQALSTQPNAYKELGRVTLSLRRSSRQMTVECPIRAVEASRGRADFTRLKRSCRIRR